WDNIFDSGRVKPASGLGIKSANEFNCCNNILNSDPKSPGNFLEITLIKLGEVLLDNFTSKRIIHLKMIQLQKQRFVEVVSTNSWWIKGLDDFEHSTDLRFLDTKY